MKEYTFWFVVGSQLLYGPEVLETVAARGEEMARELSRHLPYPLVYKVTAKSNQEIAQVVKEANYDSGCAGIRHGGYGAEKTAQRGPDGPAEGGGSHRGPGGG